MRPVLFFADLCPDTKPFIEKLTALDIEFEAVEIMSSMANFKRFLALRDNHIAFDDARIRGYIGIPALLIGNQVILDLTLLEHIQ